MPSLSIAIQYGSETVDPKIVVVPFGANFEMLFARVLVV